VDHHDVVVQEDPPAAVEALDAGLRHVGVLHLDVHAAADGLCLAAVLDRADDEVVRDLDPLRDVEDLDVLGLLVEGDLDGAGGELLGVEHSNLRSKEGGLALRAPAR
jgi:hypothetical protein